MWKVSRCWLGTEHSSPDVPCQRVVGGRLCGAGIGGGVGAAEVEARDKRPAVYPGLLAVNEGWEHFCLGGRNQMQCVAGGGGKI